MEQVLIVEDEPKIAEVLREHLENAGVCNTHTR